MAMRGIAASLPAFIFALRVAAASSTVECQSGNKASSCVTGHAKQPPVLMQVQAEASKTSDILQSRARADGTVEHNRNVATASIVAHMRRFRADPSNIVEALTKGIRAVQSAFPFFMNNPPEISKGISTLGLALLESIDVLLTEDGKKSWSGYEKFQQLWKKAFEELPATADDIKRALDSFSSSGDPAELTKAIFGILTEAVDTILNVETNEIGHEIARFIDTVKDTFSFVGEAVHEFEKGDIPASVETTYFGLRSVAKILVPEDQQNDAVFTTVVGALDGLVGGLSQDMLDYKRKSMEKAVCWKDAKSRVWTKPSVCPERYAWDHKKHCWPEMCWEPAVDCVPNFKYKGHAYKSCSVANHNKPWCSHDEEFGWGSSWSDCVKVKCHRAASLVSAGLEETTAWKRQINGTIPASCDASSKHPEKIGGWCYSKCPLGYEPDGGRCWTACSGGVPASWPLMCGRDAGVLMSASVEMASALLHVAMTGATVAEKVNASGVDAEIVSTTIDTFIKLGKPFSYSTCSQLHIGGAIKA